MDKTQSERDSQWREFLKEERDQRNESIKSLAEEIKSVSQEVNRLNGVITAHDARTKEIEK